MERDQVSKLISDNIARLMAEREMNAAQLAEKAGLNRTAVYDIIAARSQSPKVKTVSSLAAALGVPISDLFFTTGQVEAQREILKTFQELPEADQRRLQAIADAFLPRLEA